LLVRWVKSVDPTVPDLGMGPLEIAPGGALSCDAQIAPEWHTLPLPWREDEVGAPSELTLDGQPARNASLTRNAHHGISYIQIQATSRQPDSGLLIGSIEVKVQALGAQ
jgi:hypothetical protein